MKKRIVSLGRCLLLMIGILPISVQAYERKVVTTTEVTISVAWHDSGYENERPGSVVCELLATAGNVTSKYADVVLSKNDNYTLHVVDLPTRNNDGVDIRYSIQIQNVPENYIDFVNGYIINLTRSRLSISFAIEKNVELLGSTAAAENSFSFLLQDTTSSKAAEDYGVNFGELKIDTFGVGTYNKTFSGILDISKISEANGWTKQNGIYSHEFYLIECSELKTLWYYDDAYYTLRVEYNANNNTSTIVLKDVHGDVVNKSSFTNIYATELSFSFNVKKEVYNGGSIEATAKILTLM